MSFQPLLAPRSNRRQTCRSVGFSSIPNSFTNQNTEYDKHILYFGGDGGSFLAALALDVTPRLAFSCRYATSKTAPHLARLRRTHRSCILCNTHQTNKEDKINLPSLLVETVGVEPTSKMDENKLLRV